jgi:protease-4
VAKDTPARLVYFPVRKTGFEALEDIFGASAESAQASASLAAIAARPEMQRLLEELAMVEAMNKGELQARAPHMKER